MSTLDLYADDFPHGSPAGYDAGCKGSACPNSHSDELQTCRDAFFRYQRDLPYRRAVDAGHATAAKPVEGIPSFDRQVEIAVDAMVARANGTAMVDVRTSARSPKPAPPTAPVALEQREEVGDGIPTTNDPTPPASVYAETPNASMKPKRLPQGLALDDPDFPHGTTAGHTRGCKVDDTCPSSPTCREAKNAYLRDWNEKRKQNSSGTGTTAKEEPTGETQPPAQEPTDDAQISGPDAPTSIDQEQASPAPLENLQHITRLAAGGVIQPPKGVNIAYDPPEQIIPLRAAELENLTANLASEKAAHADTQRDLDEVRLELDEVRLELDSTRAGHNHDWAGFYAENAQLRTDLKIAQAITRLDTALDTNPETPPWNTALAEALPAGQLALTIDPTEAAGVRLTFDLPALGADNQLQVNVAVASSEQPGLGNLAISVGHR
ncbi:MAG: hypothetical protein ABJB03_00370 [Rhodoglobus sp.]